jgi:hypothetical protein
VMRTERSVRPVRPIGFPITCEDQHTPKRLWTDRRRTLRKPAADRGA